MTIRIPLRMMKRIVMQPGKQRNALFCESIDMIGSLFLARSSVKCVYHIKSIIRSR